jgi:hypothetical protein
MNKKISLKKAALMILIPSFVLGSIIFWQLLEFKKERGSDFKGIGDILKNSIQYITDSLKGNKNLSKELSYKDEETQGKTSEKHTELLNQETFLVYNLNYQKETTTQKATTLIVNEVSIPLDAAEAAKVFEKVQGGILCTNPKFEYKDYVFACKMEKTENGWLYVMEDAIASSSYAIDEKNKEIKISGGY